MQTIIPDQLMEAHNEEQFQAWLAMQRLDKEDKKQLLQFWADRVGLGVDMSMLRRAGIESYAR